MPTKVDSVAMEEEGKPSQKVDSKTRKRKAEPEEETHDDEEEDDDEESGSESDSEEDSDEDEDEDTRTVNFRNYKPRDKKLAKNVIDNFNFIKQDLKWLDGEIKALETKSMTLDEDKLSIAPKTPNWDLKRDIKDKLGILNRMTKVAIKEFLETRKKEEESDEESGSDDSDEDGSSSSSDEDEAD
ncbi:hypothetical protein AAMO2058_000258200 [Amorphochlora amoebiformis]